MGRREYKQDETTKLHAYLRTADPDKVRQLSVAKLLKQLRLNISVDYGRRLIRRFYNDKGGVVRDRQVEPTNSDAVLAQIASVVSKTHAYVGDMEEVSSEDSNKLIVRILRRYDQTLLERGLRSRLPK